MSSKVKIVMLEELKPISTAASLNRRKKLLQREETFDRSGRYGFEESPDEFKIGYMEFKDQPQKNIFATREQSPNLFKNNVRSQCARAR